MHGAPSTEDENGLSIFVRPYPENEKHAPYRHLVVTERVGRNLVYSDSWRLLAARGFDAGREPLDLLKHFVELYGIDFRLPGLRDTSRFILYKTYHSPDFDVRAMSEEDYVNKRTGHTYTMQMNAKKSSNGDVSILLGYAIDETQYVADLKASGLL
jgi:hypothetical protein